jgi:hypothetical protein
LAPAPCPLPPIHQFVRLRKGCVNPVCIKSGAVCNSVFHVPRSCKVPCSSFPFLCFRLLVQGSLFRIIYFRLLAQGFFLWVHCLRCLLQDSLFRILCLRLLVEGSLFRVPCSRFLVHDSSCRVTISGFSVLGSLCRALFWVPAAVSWCRVPCFLFHVSCSRSPSKYKL